MEKEDFKLIDKALDAIIKKHGKANIIDLKENPCIERFPIESIAISDLLGGGLPRGRIVELYGNFSSGKSLIAMYFAKQIQKLSDGFVIYIDYEYSFSNEFAIRNGVDTSPEKFLLLQPDDIEQGADMLIELTNTGKVAYAVWDSTNASSSRGEITSEVGSALMGNNARSLGSFQRRVLGVLSQTKTTLLFISQIRDSMSQYSPQAIGVGKCTGFNASVRLEVKRVEYIENDKKEPIGIKMIIKTKKNKTANPNKEIELDFYFDGGIDTIKELTDYAIKFDIIKKMGSWFEIVEGKRVQGKEKVSEMLKAEPELLKNIKESVDKYLKELNIKDQQIITDVETPLKREKPIEVETESITTGKKSTKKEKVIEPDVV
jgi:recombination protein RecA